MIEMNVVLRDVSQLIRSEIELRRVDVGAHGARISGIAIDRPRPLVVAYGEYPARDIGLSVIECGQDDRGAELSFVDQICRQFVIAIKSDSQAGNNDLVDPDIEIMRPLCPDNAVLLDGGGGRRIVEECDRGRRDEFERRWYEVARIAGMDRRGIGRLHDQVYTRAELSFIGELIDPSKRRPVLRVRAGEIRHSS